MLKEDWRAGLKNHFDNIKILEKSKAEALLRFDQFCEFIVEPAFESLADELAGYGIKARHVKSRGREIRLIVCFADSKEEQFQYKITLPKNSIELRLTLCVRARKTAKAEYQAQEEAFLPETGQDNILKLEKDVVILDVIEHYRNFIYEALTTPD
jgi:hypothetical protein